MKTDTSYDLADPRTAEINLLTKTASMYNPNDEPIRFPIIDSHIHLYAADHIEDLAWAGALLPDHILNRQNSLAEYRAASTSRSNLLGFIFVETDRKSSLSEVDWQHALEEVEFLRRIKAGTPLPGEGHNPEDDSLLLGAVPWAPLPADPTLFTRYLDNIAQTEPNPTTRTSLIKGFRYLMQDKPPGTQLNPNITTNLLTLESRGYKTFDLGVDFHQNGHTQLEESIEMLDRFYASSTGHLKIVVNHLCKPDLCVNIDTDDPTSQHALFQSWSMCIRRLSSFPSTYMKLSGLFSEMPPDPDLDRPRTVSEHLRLVRPYTRAIFECFGARRIMFGSDWPVCNVGGPGEKSWMTWVEVVREVLEAVGLTEEEKGMVWGGTAREVYGIDVDIENGGKLGAA